MATYSIRSLLPALTPHASRLVGPAARERLAQLASRLPAIGSCGAFELHLGSGEERADLLIFSDGQGGRRELARDLDASLLAGPELRSLFSEWTLPGSMLETRTSHIWLEYDLPEGRESRLPMVYFGLLGLSPAELGELAQRIRQLLTGRAATATETAQRRTLEHCMRTLPEDGQVTFLADPCLSRGVQPVRLIAQVPREHAWSWLASIGWQGSREQWERAAAVFANCPRHISLYLDVADTVGPKLGVESLFPASEGARELWEGLAAQLVDLGVTTAAESAAILSWAGAETVDLPDHESLVRIGRSLSFKLVLEAQGAISAKGYLAFRAREALF
ncbi:MAG TPA: hypothetical protein VFE33_27815 [Thermoanaerobaculia bacterium]|nr:hypothetical protein [Thermoanaerobaculia bacterium]